MLETNEAYNDSLLFYNLLKPISILRYFGHENHQFLSISVNRNLHIFYKS